MSFNKIYGCCLTAFYLILAEVIISPITFLITGEYVYQYYTAGWTLTVIILCELLPAIFILLATFKCENKSTAAQIFLPLLLTVLAVIVAGLLWLIIGMLAMAFQKNAPLTWAIIALVGIGGIYGLITGGKYILVFFIDD